MLNNNFRKILNYMFKNTKLVVEDNMVGLDGEILGHANGGSIPSAWLNTSKQAILTSDTSATQGVFIAYGDGTNEATSNDYNLEREITDLTLLGNSVSITDNGYIVTSSVKNTLGGSISVKELGIFETSKSEYGDRQTFMLARSVLETPITLMPNEIKTFTITINF